jgi:diguanylate cyclase (GGDEF)-like protein/PAS domain S-box-containing protein
VRAPRARPSTLLLVEGIDSAAERFQSILRATAPDDFEVTRATNLAEAISQLESSSPDCAIVNIDLVGAGSLEIFDTLAAGSSSVAFVGLTDRDDEQLGVTTMRAGPVDVLSTSALDGKLLVGAIRHAITLRRLETSLDEMQSFAHVGSWEVDLQTGTVTWSHELYRLLGFGLDQAVGYTQIIDRVHRDDREATVASIETAIGAHSPFIVEHRVSLPDGSERWVAAQGRAEYSADGRPERLIGMAQDITERKAAAAAVLHQELHDPLTGLPNRRLLVDRLEQALARLSRVPSMVGVIYLDIDRFKVINDNLGYAAGDQLLLATAARVRDLIRPEDTLARMDGDEFVVLCEGLSDQAEGTVVADRICAAMTEPLAWKGGELVISVSAGIALAISPSVEAGILLGDADAAMYRAKAAGRARSALFAETMRPTGVGRLDTETSLRQSIINGDLRVHYQPVVSLVNGQVLGHEALVRWAHPARGLLGPDEFITIAEESGLIVPLGAWVLREACRQAKRFQTRDPRWPRLMMSVNLSDAQFAQPDLVDLIASALHDADLSAEDLQLEMTESVLMDDAPRTIGVLNTLHDLGVQLSIDDFGTGYSSLAYLRRFPVDVLKIDRTFVGGLGKDLEDSAIVAAVVNLADTLGLTTIAEGVETDLQRDCLISLGCSRAQGFLYARPVAADEAETALDRVSGTVALRP